jgi:CelD/BcsL family acetyltransferase involved in cellulose biosynthesis
MAQTTQRWSFDWKLQWNEVWQDRFVEEWQAAANSSSSTIFSRPELVRVWAETHGAAVGARPSFGVVRSCSGQKILLPWVVVNRRTRFGSVRRLGPVGQIFFGYNDPILVDTSSQDVNWPAFWRQARASARGQCDEAHFSYVHADYARCEFETQCAEASPVLDLDQFPSIADALQQISWRYRKDIGRQLRRLGDLGPVEFRMFPENMVCEALADFRTGFVPAYSTVWGNRSEGNILSKAGVVEFIEGVIREGLLRGWASYATLSVGGTAVAWLISLADRDCLYPWMTTYSRAYENLSPGKILFSKAIDYAIEKKVKHFHFLTGGNPYKLAWRPRIPDLRSIQWSSPTMRGLALRLRRSYRERALAQPVG